MNAVATYFACTDLLHEQKIELFQRLRHAGQKAACLPAFGRCQPSFRAGSTMIDLQQERTE